MIDLSKIQTHKKLFLFIVLLIGNVIFFAAVASLMDMRFEENDDVYMCMIANGVYGGVPDGHLIFINAIYGYVVAGLYKLCGSIEWYTVLFAICHILSMSIIAFFSITNTKLNRWLRIAFMVFMYVLWIRIIIRFQFTTTAAITCFAGCLALVQSKKKWSWVGVALILLSSLIRYQATALVFALFAPILFREIILNRKLILRTGILVVLMIACFLCDKLFYQQPEWRDYCLQNEQRLAINDTRNSNLAEDQMPDNINYEDFLLVLDWATDPNVLGYEELRQINQALQSNFNWSNSIRNLKNLLYYRIQLVFIIIGFCLCFLCVFRSHHFKDWMAALKSKTFTIDTFLQVYDYFFPIICLLCFLGLTCYIEGVMIMKDRVFICLLMPSVYCMLYCTSQSMPKILVYGILVVFIGLSCKYAYQVYKQYKENQRGKIMVEKYQNPLVLDKQDYWIYGLNINHFPPFQIREIPIRIVTLGWQAGIPFNKGVLEKHTDFIDSNILLIRNKGNRPNNIVQAIYRNYDIPVRLEVLEENEVFELMHIVSISNKE